MALGRVYSTRFFQRTVNNLASNNLARYTVPAGKLAVVRSISIVVYGIGDIYIGNVGGDSWWLLTRGTASGADRQWSGAQVVLAGETLGVKWVSGDMSISCSGYLLTTV